MSTGEDNELIPRVRLGDLAAFEALYDKYKGQVYRTALAIIRDRSAAEDILQECFLRVYVHIDKIDVSRPLSPWIHRIAVNLSYNWVTKRQRWFPLLGEVVDQFVGDHHGSPEHILEREELQRIVQEAIHSLSFAQRVVIILFYLNGFSLEEIAYILDCPVGTVKSRLYYGRQNLKRKLGADKRLPAGVAYEFP
ncbi:MAG: sigma-70 family RNA polymerase sigma factor [Anaerolineae bacterium]|nr:sigma-70 family RNA polymerase sigma factor [Anaerolineae bacterium]